MAPPSIFILLSASFLSMLHPCRTEPLGHTGGIVDHLQMELPQDIEATQLLLESQQLRDLANELALDYLNQQDGDNIFSNIAKRDPGTDDSDNKDTEYEVFVRRGVPPSVVKLTYGKRSDDKRFNSPFFFGKRENVNELDKRGYSRFMFGKREMESPYTSEKRARYTPSFMFGKRDNDVGDGDDEDLEQVKRGYSALYFGKRGHRSSHYSKFLFGKRDNDGDSGMAANEDQVEQNFEKKDVLRENKRFRSAFYLGKRNYVPENDDMEDLKDV